MNSNIKYYFGIDFGTTNCACVGYMASGNAETKIKCGDLEDRPIPSTVAIDSSGKIYVGREAWEKKLELSATCTYFRSIKTILDSDKKYNICGKSWTAVDIAGEVFRHLKENVRARMKVEMRESVVAIPIGFNAVKRRKLRQAAALAGIKIAAFISEPTAAFFANYNDFKSCTHVAIFDWGGGTLDVSVIRHSGGKVFELATAGMSIAGDDIDRKISERIHGKIARKKNISRALEDMPPNAQDMLRVRSEQAKITLADDDDATISINQYGEYGACREMIDYFWFGEIIAPEIERAVECLDGAVAKSGIGLANIDRIVLVGGSSNLRPLIDRLDEKYGDKLFFPEETMWNVGEGAALLARNPGGYHSNQSLGILLSDGSYYELLERGADIKSWRCQCTFGVVDTTEQARFVFASREVDGKVSSEDFKTLNLPNYGFLQEKIIVDAAIDSDLIFTVTAKSDMQPKDYRRIWKYDKLKFYYQLPWR